MKKLLTLLALLGLSIGIYAQTAIDKEKLFDFYQTQRYGDAAQYLKGIYGEEVNDFKTLSQIGYCFLMAGNNVEAEKFYSKAYTLQPQNLPILFSLGSTTTKGGIPKRPKSIMGKLCR